MHHDTGLAIVLLVAVVLVYFLPSVVGSRHPQVTAIFALNFLLGWSVIGWVAAFVWACVTPSRAATQSIPSVSGLRKCPDCAEMIQRDARKCRFCGREMEPLPENSCGGGDHYY